MLYLGETASNIAITDSGDIFAVGQTNTVKIYERQSNGGYTYEQTVSDYLGSSRIGLSSFGSYLVFLKNTTTIKIFERVNGAYTQIFQIIEASNNV